VHNTAHTLPEGATCKDFQVISTIPIALHWHNLPAKTGINQPHKDGMLGGPLCTVGLQILIMMMIGGPRLWTRRCEHAQ